MWIKQKKNNTHISRKHKQTKTILVFNGNVNKQQTKKYNTHISWIHKQAKTDVLERLEMKGEGEGERGGGSQRKRPKKYIE